MTGFSSTVPGRVGLMLSKTELIGNSIGIPSRSESNGQYQLTQRYFYDPIFNEPCAMIEERGNPIDSSGTYFTPQNGGTAPSNSDCSRYATLTYFDYQKNAQATVTGNSALQALLGMTATQIGDMISFVNSQMTATDGSGGIPAGFTVNLGDINGDGTGDGASSGLPAAAMLGNVVKVQQPAVTLVQSGSSSSWTANQDSHPALHHQCPRPDDHSHRRRRQSHRLRPLSDQRSRRQRPVHRPRLGQPAIWPAQGDPRRCRS